MSLVEIRDLAVEYGAGARRVRALDGVDFSLGPGEIVALVGESGCGKSTLASAIGHLPSRGSRRVSGSVRVEGREVAELDPGALREFRRSSVGYVFQNPVASLDPTMRLGRQIAFALEAGPAEAAAALEGFGFSNIGRVLAAYPHEVSGGMAQRVTIAMVMRREPQLIIADEPTAALDAPARAQILKMLVSGCRRLGAGLVLVTHDLQSVETGAERIFVMYAGRIVESGPTREVLARPRHPYTAALLASAVGRERPGEIIEPIPGGPPHLREPSRDCAFAPRCRHTIDICRTRRPEPRGPRGTVLCHLVDGASA